ncbi:MAG: hypothetical protein HFJ45_04100 [Clostridia bacterium]|nr:hypothetical protein [Clostridia bacterium]
MISFDVNGNEFNVEMFNWIYNKKCEVPSGITKLYGNLYNRNIYLPDTFYDFSNLNFEKSTLYFDNGINENLTTPEDWWRAGIVWINGEKVYDIYRHN